MKSRSVGTKLMIDTKKVGGLTSITGVEVSAETTEVTALDNQDGYREYLGGFKDGGEVPVEGYLDGEDEGQNKMFEALEDQAVHDFQIVFPKAIGKTWSFKGVVTKFATAAALQDAIKYSGSIKVSGKPTLAATPAEG
jgi:predicted secreted protein